MGRNSSLRMYNPVLTKLAQGYKNGAFIGTSLFPVVYMDKEAGQIPQFGKEAFEIYNTSRGIRGQSNLINPEDIESIDVVLKEHDLGYPVDYRESNEAKTIFNLERHATNTATKGIELKHEKLCSDLANADSSYLSANIVTLSGNDLFSDYENSDPSGVFDTGKDKVRQQIGVEPNTLVMGLAVYKILKRHPQVLDKIKYSMKGIATIELLKQILEFKNIHIGSSLYKKADGTFGELWGKNIQLAYIPEKESSGSRDMYEPSFGYTFKQKGFPKTDQYDDQGGKVKITRVTDMFKPAVVAKSAGYLIKSAIA